MGEYRHGTDRQETVAVAGCPNGCQTLELETTGDPDAIEELLDIVKEAFGECEECGAEFGLVRQDEQKEVLD